MANLDGLCKCGCGRQTNLAPFSHKKREWIKGQPLDYIHGHNSTNKKADGLLFNKEKNRWMVSRKGKRAQYRSRVIMEQILGRKLETKEHVHHKDLNPLDDSPENLQVLTIHEHGSIHSGKIDDHEMLNNLRKMATKISHAPSSREWDQLKGSPHSCTYRVHFGSWFNALELANLIDQMPDSYRVYKDFRGKSDKFFLSKLKELSERLGHSPTLEDIDEAPDIPSSRTYSDRFGSIYLARKLAGIESNSTRRKRRCS